MKIQQPGQNWASTAAPLYVLLRIRNRVKTRDAYFVQDYRKSFFFLILFFLLFGFFFFYFFGFFLFYFFWIFFCVCAQTKKRGNLSRVSCCIYIFAYFIGFIIHKLLKAGLIPFFSTHRCLLHWAYDPQATKSGSHPFFFTHRCLLDWAYDPQAAKSGSHPFFFHTQMPTSLGL